MTRTTTAFALALLAVAGCAGGEAVQPLTVDDLVGCYQVDIGAWVPPVPGFHGEYSLFAPVFEFTHELGENGLPVMRPGPGIDVPKAFDRGWYTVNKTGATVYWAIAEDMWQQFNVRGNAFHLSGTVESIVESVPLEHTAPVTLTRVECP